MRKEHLKQNLLHYINSHEGWHKKVHLFVYADELGYSPESAGRRLRELVKEKKIKVDYYKGKFATKLAKYGSLETVEKKPQYIIKIINGNAVAVYE